MKKIFFLIFSICTFLISAQTETIEVNGHGQGLNIVNSAVGVGTYINLDDHDGNRASIISLDSDYSNTSINNSLSFVARYGKNFRFFTSTDANVGIQRLTILNNGNIGIGVINPASELEVNGDISLARTKKIKFLETIGGNDRAYITSSNCGNGDCNPLIFAVSTGNEAMRISGGGNVGIGTDAPTMKLELDNLAGYDGIKFGSKFKIRQSDISNNHFVLENIADSGNLYLRSRGGNTSNTTGNIVLNDSGGNVGIGTTAPASKLEVNGDISLVRSKKIKFLETVGGDDRAYIRSTNCTGEEGCNSLVFAVGDGYEAMEISGSGDVGIGTTTTGNHKLAVEGSIGAREIKVEAGTWSDFVFENDYNLPTLKEVENHIQEKGHLQDIPSAAEVAENGFYLGEMDAKLLQKIEELTLYTIEQEKKLEKQNKENEFLKTQLLQLVKRLEVLESK